MNIGSKKTCQTDTFFVYRIICLSLFFFMLSLGTSWARPNTKASAELADMQIGNIDYNHDDNSIVINDMVFFVDKNTKIFGIFGTRVSKSELNKGDFVRFTFSNEQHLQKVYITKKGEQKKTPTAPAPKASSQDMHQENGVWTN